MSDSLIWSSTLKWIVMSNIKIPQRQEPVYDCYWLRWCTWGWRWVYYTTEAIITYINWNRRMQIRTNAKLMFWHIWHPQNNTQNAILRTLLKHFSVFTWKKQAHQLKWLLPCVTLALNFTVEIKAVEMKAVANLSHCGWRRIWNRQSLSKLTFAIPSCEKTKKLHAYKEITCTVKIDIK